MSELILTSRNQHNFENSEYYRMYYRIDLIEQLIYLVNYLIPLLFTRKFSGICREAKRLKLVVVRDCEC